MRILKKLSPKNSILLLMGDSINGQIPLSMFGKGISVTPSCIAIGTLSEFDGECTVLMTSVDLALEAEPKLTTVYEGVIELVSNKVGIYTVNLEPIAELPAIFDHVNIKILTNDSIEPDFIKIVVSEG